jgi:hypothetical protein
MRPPARFLPSTKAALPTSAKRSRTVRTKSIRSRSRKVYSTATKDFLVRRRRANKTPNSALRRGGDVSVCSRATGSGTRPKRVIGLVVVKDQVRSGRSTLVTNPRLNDFKPLRSLVDIVKIGDVVEGSEQLNQTFSSAADGIDCQYVSIQSNLFTTRSQTDITGHPYPRSSPTRLAPELERAYANRASIRTTNMEFGKDLHKIFEIPIRETP